MTIYREVVDQLEKAQEDR
jgi:hypothetical protein